MEHGGKGKESSRERCRESQKCPEKEVGATATEVLLYYGDMMGGTERARIGCGTELDGYS